MELNHSKSVTTHNNRIKCNVKYVHKLTLNKATFYEKGEIKN